MNDDVEAERQEIERLLAVAEALQDKVKGLLENLVRLKAKLSEVVIEL
jgi:hypothetical protein